MAPAVSLPLSLGEKEGIIKVVVQIPRGVYTDMEERLAAKFHLKDVVIADCSVDRESPVLNISLRTLQTYRSNRMLPYTQIGYKMFYKPKDVEKLICILGSIEVLPSPCTTKLSSIA